MPDARLINNQKLELARRVVQTEVEDEVSEEVRGYMRSMDKDPET